MKRLCAIGYNPSEDAFYLEFSLDGGRNWETEAWWKCRAREGSEDGELDYVHWSLIDRLDMMVRVHGYTFIGRR